jgi:uncharacterized membrane protein
MKTYSHEQILDEMVGKKGTPERERYDAEVEKGIKALRLGDVLREERRRQNLTQRQLGEMALIDESTVSKVENGKSASFFAVSSILQALGISATFDMGRLGRVAL